MFCGSCGEELFSEGRYCQHCGSQIRPLAEQDEDHNGVEVIRYIPAGLMCVMLFIAIFGNIQDYDFFILLRWVVTVGSVYYSYLLYKRSDTWTFYGAFFALNAILFNPIVPVYLARSSWVLVDLLVMFMILGFFFWGNIGSNKKE